VPIEVRAVTDTDAGRVGEFLHTHLNPGVPAELWARSLRAPWDGDGPNSGFMLLDDGAVVGAHLAFYSERTIDGRRERFCNLGPWSVRQEYRLHGLRLLMALLAQDDYHFTDLTPSESVVAVNTRLSFRFLDTATVLVLNLPWPSGREGVAVSSDRAFIERTLTGPELQIYRDHVAASAARHTVLVRGDQSCYVMFRRQRRRRMSVASILYVSDPPLLRTMTGPLARHLLLRHGIVATLAELRIVGHRPQPSVRLRSPPRKMFRSDRLDPAQIDDLYSELVCLPW
jgi:hypothetical protein